MTVPFELTVEQATERDRLADHYASVEVLAAPEGRDVVMHCYEVGLPERCVFCGVEAEEHRDEKRGWPLGHSFRVAVPVRSYRVAPSGFRQRVDRLESGVAA